MILIQDWHTNEVSQYANDEQKICSDSGKAASLKVESHGTENISLFTTYGTDNGF